MSFYSVLRYFPDPVAGECINFGVLVLDDDCLQLMLLHNWARLVAFNHNDPNIVTYLQNWAFGISQVLAKPGCPGSRVDYVKQLSKDCIGCVRRITEPHASVDLSAEELAVRFLKE